jgi:hypothetical protein
MSKPIKSTILVCDTEVTVVSFWDEDFITLTDMLKAKDGGFFISDWLRNRNTVEFLGIWETVHMRTEPGCGPGKRAERQPPARKAERGTGHSHSLAIKSRRR